MKKYYFALTVFLYSTFTFHYVSTLVEMDPLQLLTPNRVDIVAKYIYVKYQDKNIQSDFGKKLYSNLIESIAFQRNIFHNITDQEIWKYQQSKTNVADHIFHFNNLAKSIKTEGFKANISHIPLDKYLIPIDGAHRVATAIFYHKNIPTKKYPQYESNFGLTFEFLKKSGVRKKYIDAMVLEYCRLKKNTFIAFIFPSVQYNTEIEKILEKYTKIIYKKCFLLNKNGPRNLLIALHQQDAWIGSIKDNFPGLKQHLSKFFPTGSGIVTAIVLEAESLEKIKTAKKEVRDFYNIGNFSIHINDTYTETIQAAESIFLQNSIFFLNKSTPVYFKNLENNIRELNRWVNTNNIDPESICITKGNVLSAYGVRDSHDLDFLEHTPNNTNNLNLLFDIDNKQEKDYGLTIDDIIYNPKYHFYHRSFKFLSLDILKQIKEKYGREKDKKDLKAIKLLLEKTTSRKINLYNQS